MRVGMIEIGKLYTTGLFVTKLQPLHNGHVQVISAMIEHCQRAVVVLENDPKSRLPWSLSDRIEMLDRVFKGSIIVKYLEVPAITSHDSWKTKLLKFSDVLLAIKPYDPEVFFGIDKEIASHYVNFIQVLPYYQSITEEMVRNLIKSNDQTINSIVPEEILPILYRNIDINSL